MHVSMPLSQENSRIDDLEPLFPAPRRHQIDHRASPFERLSTRCQYGHRVLE